MVSLRFTLPAAAYAYCERKRSRPPSAQAVTCRFSSWHPQRYCRYRNTDCVLSEVCTQITAGWTQPLRLSQVTVIGNPRFDVLEDRPVALAFASRLTRPSALLSLLDTSASAPPMRRRGIAPGIEMTSHLMMSPFEHLAYSQGRLVCIIMI
ncbi:hypothetical protein BD309DRAFT_965171 [Dichomitus squalens]|nr:hypothetical protein BD309DRAFT_965171 [Dichomitus squalens]